MRVSYIFFGFCERAQTSPGIPTLFLVLHRTSSRLGGLMLYKPKYCCDCGDRIDRREWNILTNRRFCELCETRYKFEDISRKFGAFILIAFGFFGVGSYLTAAEKVIEIKRTGRAAEKRGVSASKRNGGIGGTNKRSSVAPPKTRSTDGRKSDAKRETKVKRPIKESPQNVVSEPVYFCGAATKKGSPCSRRVRGGGRCWQHKGQESIIRPQQKGKKTKIGFRKTKKRT